MDLVRFNPGKGLREIRETRRSGVYQGVCAPLPPEQKVGGSNPLGRTKSIYNQRFAGLYANNGGRPRIPNLNSQTYCRKWRCCPERANVALARTWSTMGLRGNIPLAYLE